MSNIFSIDSGLPTVPPDTLFYIQDFPVTNSMLAGAFLTILIVIFAGFVLLFTKKTGTPSKFQIFLETLYVLFLSFIEQIVGSKKVAQKILPIIGTIFIYIGLSNILTIVPGIDSLIYTVDGTTYSFFRTHTSDINTTFGIAAAMIIATQMYSIAETNIFIHFGKYIKILPVIKGFRKSIGDGFIAIIDLFVGLLDIVSEFAKSISLSLRLFGNMFSGLMLGGIILGALAIIAPIPLLFLSLFSGLLQALVFGALAASYFGMAVDDSESKE